MRFFIGFILSVIFAIFIFVFGPVILEQTKFGLNQIAGARFIVETEPLNSFEKRLDPVNTEFSIIVPKIGAVAAITEDVNPLQRDYYLDALADGLAHAQNTSVPGEYGNIYLFAHSEDSFWHINSYNAQFYFLNKLERGDLIYIYYKDRRYEYKVDTKKVIDPFQVKYEAVYDDVLGKTLTLQTNTPAGTTLKRLIIIANQENK